MVGSPVIGIWSIMNTPLTIDIAAHAGLDFQILDMEHGVYDLPSLDNCIRAAESVQCSPLIRVPGLDPTIIQNCLDMGAHGIIVPRIKNFHDVTYVIQATKFNPIGSRGFNPFTRASGYHPTLPLDTTKLNNTFGLTSIILENQSALSALDDILTLPALEMLYIGVYDLSFDLGLHGQIDHPEITKIITTTISKIRKANKFSGIMVKNQEEMEKYLSLNVNMLVYGVDTHLYYSTIKRNVDAFRKITQVTAEFRFN